MPSYIRRVDICHYPAPAASIVAEKLKVERDYDFLIFKTPDQKLEFDRCVREHGGIENGS